MLLDAGADCSAGDVDGQTPEDRAHSVPVEPHPGGNPGANFKSISHRCHLREVAIEWELTKETIHLPLGCLQGGSPFLLVQVKALLRERWRARHVAFAMGLHPRLGEGAGCLVQALDPEVLRMVCDAVDGK